MEVTTKSAANRLPPLSPGEFRFTTKALMDDMQAEEANGRRRFRTIASSTIKDLRNDEMQMSALENMRDAFRAGIPIFMNHKYEVPENSFGVSDMAEIKDSGERDEHGHVIYDLHVAGYVDEANPRAVQLHESIRQGMKFGASVGAIVKSHKRNGDGGMTIAGVNLKEASIVGIAMNQRSWVQKSADAAQALEDSGLELDDEDEAVATATTTVTTTVTNGVPEGTNWVTPSTNTTLDTIVITTTPAPETTKGLTSCSSCGHDTDCSCDGCDCSAGHGHHEAHSEHSEGIDSGVQMSGEEALAGDDAITKGTTEGGQEADPAATPETAPDEEEDAADPATQKAIEFASEDVVTLVRKTADLIQVIGQRDDSIAALREEIATLKGENQRLNSENEQAAQVIKRVMTQPLRRRAVGEVVELQKALPAFFDPEVADFIQKAAKSHQENN